MKKYLAIHTPGPESLYWQSTYSRTTIQMDGTLDFANANWAQCYQMELRWRFRDLIKCFKSEKNCFNMQFAFLLNEFGPKMNK